MKIWVSPKLESPMLKCEERADGCVCILFAMAKNLMEKQSPPLQAPLALLVTPPP